MKAPSTTSVSRSQLSTARYLLGEHTLPSLAVGSEPEPLSTVGQANAPELPLELQSHPRYRVERWLGRGGMGNVWLARQTAMNRLVALKVIRSDLTQDPDAVARFRREIHAVARLHHPNIATAYDAEQVGELVFLVVQYIEGENLLETLRHGPLPLAAACSAILDAARGLAHAHALGLVHRDIKPANMIRDWAGVVRLIDFGLVAAVEDDAGLTNPAWVMGTVDYLAPEQAEDASRADARSDIYGLGCSFYHMLSGHPPFSASSPLRKLDMHRSQTPQPITGVPSALWNILERMLAKRPEHRFRSASELLVELERFCNSPSLGASPPEKRWTIGAGVGSGLTIAGLVAILLAGVVLWKSSAKPRELAANSSNNRPEQTTTAIETVGGQSPAEKPNFSLLIPSEIGDGTQEDYQVVGHILRLDGLTGGHQVWLNFAQQKSDQWIVKSKMRIVKSAARGYVKVVLLSDYGDELNIILYRSGDESWFALESPLSSKGNPTLASQQLPDNFAGDWATVELRKQGSRLTAVLDGQWTLEAPISGGRQYYPALAASGCVVEFEDPRGVIP